MYDRVRHRVVQIITNNDTLQCNNFPTSFVGSDQRIVSYKQVGWNMLCWQVPQNHQMMRFTSQFVRILTAIRSGLGASTYVRVAATGTNGYVKWCQCFASEEHHWLEILCRLTTRRLNTDLQQYREGKTYNVPNQFDL